MKTLGEIKWAKIKVNEVFATSTNEIMAKLGRNSAMEMTDELSFYGGNVWEIRGNAEDFYKLSKTDQRKWKEE